MQELIREFVFLYVSHPQSTLFITTLLLLIVLFGMTFIILFIRDSIVSNILVERSWKEYRLKQEKQFEGSHGNGLRDRAANGNRL